MAGVLRLSNNWLVARKLMAVYVEMFRNVPVLLWIVLAMAILIESLPQPRAFRGENPTPRWICSTLFAFTNRGVYIPEFLFSRSLATSTCSARAACGLMNSLDLIAFPGRFVGQHLCHAQSVGLGHGHSRKRPVTARPPSGSNWRLFCSQ